MSTNWMVPACSSSARASEIDRFGRLISSLNSAPPAKLLMPKRWMKIVLGPIVLIISRSDWSKPRIIAVIPTIDVIPMTTPSTVSAERILLPRTVSNAIDTTSPKRLTRNAIRPASFPSQRFDRIEARGPHRRIQAEKQPDERGDADAERDRPDLDRRRDRCERRDRERDDGAE